ncbi:iron-containing redox enzyme family protein [Amphiplicatus metriothermophilus]|uniref:Iron-containing redox enzyme n=1 Tax=Amphiplicatus metriothermophilus TaxID=1519374 RepID=A0A239PM70_9PROT|nr:iron-containing redox enzyme family protein [Amphiplicatus metriothermophilus]MBB5517471.1 pyrroloquinoline quinone (PQQ) biosynthesis protein C [Amphiplicatus metriothermophilus]SNT68194.1 Iron-containing redox enzyme [Amphiplicatus metriothermophilus]
MFESLKERFQPIFADFIRSEPVSLLTSGRMTVAEYRTIMREVFHHTRENPQLQVLATVYFKGRQRDMVRMFFKHAASEIGHDQLALNDYVALGGDATDVPYQNPLPATTALLAYGFYQIYNLNPLGYLGYLFFLEFTPTQSGAGMMEALRKIGVPDGAMTFLRDHTTIDQGHNRMMERYADALIRDEADLDRVSYAMKTTGYLYSQMMMQAVEDARAPAEPGWNWEELNADRIVPTESRRSVA